MKIKVIKDVQTYEKYLHEIEQLWDAEIGTSGGDCLELLVTLVHAYEAKHYPIDQDPSIKPKLTKLFGRSHLSEILNRKRLLSLEQIRQLHTLGIPAEVLLTPVHGRVQPRKKVKTQRPKAVAK